MNNLTGENPLILVAEDDKRYCAEMEVSDYMTKPDNFAGLLEMVEKAKDVCFAN